MEKLEQKLMRRVPQSDWEEIRTNLNLLPPVWKMNNGIHLVTGYKEACDLLASKKLSSEHIGKLSNDVIKFSRLDKVNNIIRASFALKDGSNHTRLRELVAPIFTHNKFKNIFSSIDVDAKNLIEQAISKSSCFEPIEALAKRLPILVNCQILGLPYEDEARLRAMIDALVAEIEFDPEKRNESELVKLIELIESFKHCLVPDWLKPLVGALKSGKISDLEFESTILLLMISGYGTATSGIGAAIATLFSNENSRKDLIDGLYSVEDFVYEALRLSPPVSLLARSACQEEIIEGSLVAKNGLVLIHVGAACRDPNTFQNPHHLNPLRANKAQLIFGGGPHFCLGRMVGLRQIEASISALLSLPLSMAIAPQEISYHPYKVIQGPLSLPLQLHHREMSA